MADTPYQAIADSTYDWETWIDERGRIRWINPAVERFTGYPRSECMSMEDFPLALTRGADRETLTRVLESGTSGGNGNDVELRVIHRDGTYRWVAISWQPLTIDDGSVRGFRTSVRDIDSRKQAEERLREAERRASRVVREQADLLATLSHELRSPLHCISGFGELIERCELTPEVQRYVAIVREQSDAALRLVEDLLHFVSFAESPSTLRSVPFDLACLVRREVDATRPRTPNGVTLSCWISPDVEGVFLGDSDRVRQVVANLLSNAVRFTSAGSIEVHINAEQRGCSIEVRDTGAGMSRELLARVKDPFVQGAPTAASRGGVGLGLTIVDRIVQAMGGALVISSTLGHGTSASVSIPLPRASNTGTPVRAREVTPLTIEGINTLRVLVVDDSEPARELLCAMFRTLGATPHSAPSGVIALEEAQHRDYDIIVLDYHMPEVDGLATARRLAAETKHLAHRPLLVMLTANVFAEAFSDPARHGIDVILPKPMRLAQVAALAARVLEADHPPRSLAVTPSNPSELGVDEEVARELCAVRGPDDTTLLARTLPRVESHVRRVVGTVRAAIRDRALGVEALVGEVHGLKGLVASVGASTAAVEAARLERTLRAHARADDVHACLEAFERTYATAHGALVRLTVADERPGESGLD